MRITRSLPINKKRLMKLSRDEEFFLRHWMYDEVHYLQGSGRAKQLQVQYGAVPADLAVLIAAAVPDPAEQQAAGEGPPPAEPPTWPWMEDSFAARVAEARAALDKSRPSPNVPVAVTHCP